MVFEEGPMLIESAQDMGIATVRIKRGINCLLKRTVLQMLPKASKHLLVPLLVKGNIGELSIQKHDLLPEK